MAFGNYHPGVTLREELEVRGMSAAALSRQLGVPSWRLRRIIHGQQAITPDTALRLGRCFGNEAEFWMSLQTQFALAELRRTHGPRIEAEVERG